MTRYILFLSNETPLLQTFIIIFPFLSFFYNFSLLSYFSLMSLSRGYQGYTDRKRVSLYSPSLPLLSLIYPSFRNLFKRKKQTKKKKQRKAKKEKEDRKIQRPVSPILSFNPSSLRRTPTHPPSLPPPTARF